MFSYCNEDQPPIFDNKACDAPECDAGDTDMGSFGFFID
jgi:hypothetical protein